MADNSEPAELTWADEPTIAGWYWITRNERVPIESPVPRGERMNPAFYRWVPRIEMVNYSGKSEPMRSGYRFFYTSLNHIESYQSEDYVAEVTHFPEDKLFLETNPKWYGPVAPPAFPEVV